MERRRFIGLSAAAGGVGVLSHPRPLAGFVGPRVRPGQLRNRGTADDPIRLSSNENPLGLCDSARVAVRDAIELANRYPSAQRESLRTELAGYLGVPEACTVFGAGSTEILQMSVQTAAAPGVRLVLADPTFEDVPKYAGPLPFVMRRVPLTSTFAHDLDRMRKAAEASGRPAVVYICNPNNPTGTVTPTAPLKEWIDEAPPSVTFLIDEAYYEYVEDPAYESFMHLAVDRSNLIVVRTFSKIFGMAGLRIGYAVAHEETALDVRRFISSNNANQLALAAASASLRDRTVIPEALQVNRDAKRIAEECLRELGLESLPTHTNFVMHRLAGPVEVYNRRMLESGIRVGRPFPPMLSWSRLSFGTPAEMERFAETLRAFRAKGWV